MRSGVRPFLSFFLLLLLGCSTAFAQGAKVSPENPAESQRDRPQERAKWFMRGRMVDGKPGAERLHRAYDQKLNNRRLQGLARATAAQGTSGETTASPRPLFVTAPPNGPQWNFLGPAPTATAAFGSNQQNYGPAVGRVTAVVVDQGDTSGNTVYIGGASGGLWKTTNAVSAPRTCDSNGVCTAPVTWTPLTDGQATLTVGSIALSPANTDCAAANPANCLILVGTGEANNSADSYYGLGILRSTNGGTSWSLISQTANGAFNFHGLGFTHIAFATDRPNIAVATAAAASGGISVGAETGGSNARGIYFSTDAGVTWTRATVSDGATTPDPGSANAVIYNAAQHKFYANIRYHAFYSSPDGTTWTRLANQPANIALTNCPSTTSSGCPLYRAEMAIVPGRDEMYVWIYNTNQNDIGIYQTKDGGQTAWTQISTTGIDTCGDGANNGCGNDSTGQGTYNIALAAVPNGSTATDLYAGGVNEYKCTIDPTLNPTCLAKPFLNLTHVYGCNPTASIAHVHPDEHGVDFLGNDGTGAFFTANPSFSPPVFFGNDGGVYRVAPSLLLDNTSGTCPPPNSTPPSPFDNLNSSAGFSMIQFVGFSQAASDATTLVGGTQDNGSPAVSSASPSSGNWLSVNNGDGGFNAINPLPGQGNEWFTSNPAPLVAGGGIQRCTNGMQCTFNPAATPPGFATVVSQNEILGDNSSFYTFFTLDPQASTRMLVGSCRVWRGNSDGSQSSSLGGNWSVLVNGIPSGGNPLSQNFDTGVSDSGATCASSTPFFVNTIAAGGPCNGPCNPGITPGSSTGGGSQVVWAGMEGIADSLSAGAQCPNGLPCGGQVWRTLTADTGTSSWCEVSGLGSGSTPPAGCPNPTSTTCSSSTPSACNINPKHYTISGIALDPNDATGKTAYVTVMGFGVGHIFRTADGGSTWAMLDGSPTTTGLPDAPADAVVADPSIANLVYVGTDVGVFSSTGNGTWTELGPSSGAGSLPNVTITQLKIYNNPSDSIPLRLRASTYGRGIWEIPISPGAGYTMAISNPALFAFAGQTATYNGNVAAFNGYTSSINITCTSGSTAPPSTCPNSVGPVTVSSPYGNFSVLAGNSTVGDFNFNITAVGSDATTLTQQTAVTFHAVDFSLGSVPSSATVAQGDTVDVSFNVSAVGQFTGNVTLSCSGIAECALATFSPAVVSLTPNVTANVRLTIPTVAPNGPNPGTATGPYTVTITGTGTQGTAPPQLHATPFSLTVTSASQAFNVTTGAASPATVKPSQTPTATINLTAGSGYSGTLTLSCAFDSTAGSPGGSQCLLNSSGIPSGNPISIPISAGQTVPATLTVNTTGALATNPRVIVTAKDVPNNASKSATISYSVVDYSLSLGAAAAIVPNGAPASVSLTLTALNGYTGTVAATCSVVPQTPVTCALSPAGPYTPNTGATPIATASITAPTNTPGGTYTVNVNTNDTAVTTLIHSQSVSAAVQDFSPPTICNSTSAAGQCDTTATVKAGASASFNISVAALGGFTSAVTLSCSSGLPSLTTCAFSTNPVNPGSTSTLTIQTTAPSVSQLRLPASHRTAPLYALWLTMPGIVVGIVGVGIAPRNRRGKLLGYIGLVVVLGILLSQAACGGAGGGSTTTPPIPKPGTPAGTYNITVTGASGSGATSLSHNTMITLTVN